MGASTLFSKTVFFRTLAGFLTLPSSVALNVDEIFRFMDKELKLGKEIKNKVKLISRFDTVFISKCDLSRFFLLQEDSDALTGHILVCASLIRSNKLDSGTDDDLSKCIRILAETSQQKMFHASLAFTFLIELLAKVCVITYQA